MDPHDDKQTIAGERQDVETTTAIPFVASSYAGSRYRVIRALGEGGQKRVFLAQDTRLDRVVVISVLKTSGLDDDGVARLSREARALARLGDHPHILTVYDIGEDGGRSFIVTQFVDGGSLATLRRSAPYHRLPIAEVLRIGKEVCEALRYAHENGIVHRDLKPDNVWLTKDGVTKLGDFGLAVGRELARVTTDGLLVGTVAYMSPEQAMGGAAGPASDLYSLGVMLYELVTGRLPFVGDTPVAVLSQHLHASPVAPSLHVTDIPRALEQLILGLLAKDPENRPPNATAVFDALSDIPSLGDSAAVPPRFVRPLDHLAAGVFVGRVDEFKRLKSSFEEAMAGRGGIALLVGEPGSGKTSTAEQLLTYARIRGAQVLRAHCHEGEGAPAYWPWVQLLRSYASGGTPESLLVAMGPGAAAIAQMDPEIARRLPELSAPPVLEPEQARFRLFDSVTSFLKNASQVRPLVALLDDLHWADAASLLLLQFLARELRGSRLLIVGTYRDLPLDPRHPLAQTLGVLTAQGLDTRIPLHGLVMADVARYIEITMGRAPLDRLVQAVFQRTEGNPFFVQEVVRLLATSGQLQLADETRTLSTALPQGVRDVVTRRIGQLSAECNRVLVTASVIGREFDVDIVESLVQLDGDRLMDVIEEATGARLVAEMPGKLGQFRFSHALIRETLYESLPPARRARLHRQIGAALERREHDDLDAVLAELAHHFFEAIPLGEVDKAVDYAVRAAARADRLLAYEEAVNQYEVALRALEYQKTPDRLQRCELYLTLGEVQTKAGLLDLARESFTRGADLAKANGSPEQFARAALGLGAGTVARTRLGLAVDEFRIGLLKAALEGVGTTDSSLRARLLAELALALYHAPADRTVLSQEAVDVSRRVGDPAALVAALYSRCVALEGFNKAEERLALAIETVRLAEQSGDAEMALRGHYRCLRERMELADLEGVEQELRDYARLAEGIRQPRYLWLVPYCQGSLATFRGDFAEGERLNGEALKIGRLAQDPNAGLFSTIVTYTILFHRGAFEAVERLLKGFIDNYPSTSRAWRLQLARMYCLANRLPEARLLFDPLAVADFDDLPIDGSFVATLAALSTICWHLGESRLAEKIFVRLSPYGNRNLVAGNSANGGGSIGYGLGSAAAGAGRLDEAVHWLNHAIEANTKMRARPWTAMASCALARVLLGRCALGDREAARMELERAREIGQQLGMNHVVSWTNSQLTRA